MRKALAFGVVLAVTVVGLPVVVVFAAGSGDAPTTAAMTDIPPAYLRIYQQATAARCPGLPWPVLAGIGKVESDHGRLGGARLLPDGVVAPPIIGPRLDGSAGVRRIADTDGGVYDMDTTYDRAVGPMQFLPTTWSSSGVDASADGVTDPHNAIDSVHSAAGYLCAHGGDPQASLRRAILAYNRSSTYVDEVLGHALQYGWLSGGFVAADAELVMLVLANPRLDIYAAGRQDIAEGRIDARILTILQLASERWTLTVSSLKTGHSRCVGGHEYEGCRVSHHWHGRAVDIAAVNRLAVTRANLDAHDLAIWTDDLPPLLRPAETGTPWAELDARPGFFSEGHHDHIHVGMVEHHGSF